MGFKDAFSRLGILGELWAFMRVRKKWWLGPILFMMVVLALVVWFGATSPVAPFIYALF
jgi:hypothetical protein